MKKISCLPLLLFCFFSSFASDTKTIYYDNGNKRLFYEMNNGMLDGKFEGFHNNGQLKMKGDFKNNQKTGVWTFWDENGVKRSQRKYQDNYSFELLAEWTKDGQAANKATIREKNDRFIAARSKKAAERQMRYSQRNFLSVGRHNANDQLLFENVLYDFLMQGVKSQTIAVYKDERFFSEDKRNEILQHAQQKPVEYIVREDLIYTQDHQVMQTTAIGICPVIEVNGERKELGWFYLPLVRNNRNATNQIEEIVTALDRKQYAGKVIKTSINTEGTDLAAVAASDADLIALHPLEYEAVANIYFMDNPEPYMVKE